MSGFQDLEIYQDAYNLAIEIHQLSFKLPKYELYEQASQICRSSKSIKDNIAEGFGRSKYKQEYIKFLTYSMASCNETLSQLTMIKDLYPSISEFKSLIPKYETLGKRINSYIRYVKSGWKS